MGRYIPTTYNEEPPGVMFLTPGGSESDQSMNTVIQLPQISVQHSHYDVFWLY